jgi:hypothetical protein
MTSISSGTAGTSGFDYVQDTTPSTPTEGETWYDTGANEAYVYDASAFVEISVTGHSELSEVVADNHHARYTNEEAQDAVGTILGGELSYDDANNTITVADPRVDVTDNGTSVDTDVVTLDFRTFMDISTATGGTVQVSGTHTDVSQGGTTVVSNTGDIDFGGNFSLSDDGDGTVSVSVSSTVDSSTTRFADSDGDGDQWTLTEDATTGNLTVSHGGIKRQSHGQSGGLSIEGSLTEGANL